MFIQGESMESLNGGYQIDQTRLRSTDEDRLSNLPDAVLQHILAFVSTKDAVRTSTLSIRWQNLWKLAPCLHLGNLEFSDENDFLSFIDKFRNFHGNSDLRKFQLSYGGPLELETYNLLKTWINVIVMCNLEHLDLCIDPFRLRPDYRFEMPQSLFLCNTLVVLKLCCAVVDVPERVSLSCLKIMHLDEVIYADDSAFRILISGCPILEELYVCRSDEDNVQLMCFSSQTLKSFTVEGDHPRGLADGILIDAPHLEYLSLRDHLSKNLVVNGLGSCLEAKFDVTFGTDTVGWGFDYELEADDSLRSSTRRFLVEISNVKSLSFSHLTLEFLYEYLKLDSLPQFHGVIHLETKIREFGWEALPALLVCCPNLKSFVLECWGEPDEFSMPGLSVPQCLLSLESITVKMFFTRNKATMDVVRYFLQNAVVLKKMTIHLARSKSDKSVPNILKKLLKLPRCSPACRIFVD